MRSPGDLAIRINGTSHEGPFAVQMAMTADTPNGPTWTAPLVDAHGRVARTFETQLEDLVNEDAAIAVAARAAAAAEHFNAQWALGQSALAVTGASADRAPDAVRPPSTPGAGRATSRRVPWKGLGTSALVCAAVTGLLVGGIKLRKTMESESSTKFWLTTIQAKRFAMDVLVAEEMYITEQLDRTTKEPIRYVPLEKLEAGSYRLPASDFAQVTLRPLPTGWTDGYVLEQSHPETFFRRGVRCVSEYNQKKTPANVTTCSLQ